MTQTNRSVGLILVCPNQNNGFQLMGFWPRVWAHIYISSHLSISLSRLSFLTFPNPMFSYAKSHVPSLSLSLTSLLFPSLTFPLYFSRIFLCLSHGLIFSSFLFLSHEPRHRFLTQNKIFSVQEEKLRRRTCDFGALFYFFYLY